MVEATKLQKKLVRTWDIFLQNTSFTVTSPVTWFSWLIRKVTKSEINHSSESLIIDWEVYMIESLWWWIIIRTRENRVNTWIKRKIKHIRMVDFDNVYNEKDYIIKALSQLDKKYDYLGVVKVFLYISFGWWNNPAREKSERSWRCSEYNAWMKDLPGWQTRLPKDFLNNDLFYTIQ